MQLCVRGTPFLETLAFPTHFLSKPVESSFVLAVKLERSVPKSTVDVGCFVTKFDLVLGCAIYWW